LNRFGVYFYKLSNGTQPVKEFLNNLDVRMRVKALDSIAILEEHGNKLREPYSSPIEKGIFELRIQFSGDITRIFYFFESGKKIILTNGFVKKTPKVPRKEIALALKYKADFEKRQNCERL
jgi:phage-related protein